jgi:Pectate lyase superfamily protein
MKTPDLKAVSNVTGTTSRWVDTVVQLKSIIGSGGTSNSRPAAIVGGYWAIGDGGGGLFYWDTSTSSGDNGVSPTQPGTIIVPTGSTSGRWIRIYSGPIDVRWFGARGDGTDVDDAPAINTAISVAGASRAAVVIPRGIYRLDAPLKMAAFVRLHGEGEASTFLEKTGASAETILFASTSGQSEVANLSIRPRGGSTQTSGGAIRFSEPMGPALVKLTDLAISAFQGIIVEGSGFAHGIGTSISEVTIERIKMAYADKGFTLCYAVNWTVQNIVLQSTVDAAPGSNIYGVWIDTETEGGIFNDIFSLGGEHSWRIARSINAGTSDRGPARTVSIRV